uniref:Speckle-type POZ protein (inferred by orthology to a human protein) n=1 Tax=Strongyloides venezuelensis TaxID=75913 RepID=A0A0K0FI13_STRVS
MASVNLADSDYLNAGCSIRALCKFSILNTNGKEEYKSIVGVENFDENKNSYCLQKFIERSNLLKRQSELLPDDRLTICFEIFYLCDDITNYSLSKEIPIEESLNMFLNDISKMLCSSAYYDCIIKCILAARSEVFRLTLENKLTEHELNIIEMNEFRLEVVKEMLNFLYTGRSHKIDKLAIEMLEIAGKYKIEGLKTIAAESLLNSLNLENVCEYLEKSEIYSAEILKEFCLRFIYLNADEIIKSEKWSKIVNLYPLLVVRIFNIAVNKC